MYVCLTKCIGIKFKHYMYVWESKYQYPQTKRLLALLWKEVRCVYKASPQPVTMACVLCCVVCAAMRSLQSYVICCGSQCCCLPHAIASRKSIKMSQSRWEWQHWTVEHWSGNAAFVALEVMYTEARACSYFFFLIFTLCSLSSIFLAEIPIHLSNICGSPYVVGSRLLFWFSTRIRDLRVWFIDESFVVSRQQLTTKLAYECATFVKCMHIHTYICLSFSGNISTTFDIAYPPSFAKCNQTSSSLALTFSIMFTLLPPPLLSAFL